MIFWLIKKFKSAIYHSPSTVRVTLRDARPALFWATTVHSPESCGRAETMIRDWVPSSLITILCVLSLITCCPGKRRAKWVDWEAESENKGRHQEIFLCYLFCSYHCGTSMCQALACQQLSNQIGQFAPQNILLRRASWQIQVCIVFQAEPHLFRQIDGQETGEEIGWKNALGSGSENEEMSIWERSSVVIWHGCS